MLPLETAQGLCSQVLQLSSVLSSSQQQGAARPHPPAILCGKRSAKAGLWACATCFYFLIGAIAPFNVREQSREHAHQVVGAAGASTTGVVWVDSRLLEGGLGRFYTQRQHLLSSITEKNCGFTERTEPSSQRVTTASRPISVLFNLLLLLRRSAFSITWLVH